MQAVGSLECLSDVRAVRRAEKQRLAKLYEAFRRINAGGSSLDQLVTIILKAVRNLVNSDHNLLMFVDNSRDQLWTKWTLGTVMDDKVSNLNAAGITALFSFGGLPDEVVGYCYGAYGRSVTLCCWIIGDPVLWPNGGVCPASLLDP